MRSSELVEAEERRIKLVIYPGDDMHGLDIGLNKEDAAGWDLVSMFYSYNCTVVVAYRRK